MVRTQVQLTEQQMRALKALASRRNQSIAALVRQAVDLLLSSEGIVDPEVRKERALAAAGRFRSGTPDLSERHDAYLAGAYGDESVR